MPKCSHTPGPWSHNSSPRFPIYATEATRRYKYVALALSQDFPAEEAAANMRLIAAAPDLLAVLLQLVKLAQQDHMESECLGSHCPLHSAIRAASAAIALTEPRQAEEPTL